jgi:Domain of unknown function (DUF4345)
MSMFMLMSRTLLMLTGLSIAAYGVYCLFYPHILQDLAYITLNNQTAITEVRAMYGGFEFTIGLYLFICGLRRSMVEQGLTLMVFSFAGLAGARAFGISVDNDDSIYNLAAVIHESASAVIAFILLRKLAETAQSN